MKQVIHNIIQNFINENGFAKNEEDVQSSYTLKILEALGWDSSKWKISTHQEIKTRKKPDILLRGSGGGTIFIIEHKAPKEPLDGCYPNKTFVEQLCEYCDAEGIYWGILTNFVEWRLYNAYQKALYFNKKYLTIVDGKPNDLEELYDFFEKISYNYLNGRKGKIIEDPIYYKPKEEIREEFFYNLKKWRALLRAYLYKNYSHFEPLVIDQQTQKILDRLIFAKVCYDKNILSQDILGSILYSTINKFKEIKKKFRNLDDKFNSELFARDVCDDFEIEDNLFEEIVTGINRIDFSNLNVHIIGEVYEDYLGELLRESQKVISVVETKEQAKRKSQGIYYTPDYIVDYIVENTLGEILKKCKTEEEVEKITVLDPACGSGSFLIRAFDEFYNRYKEVKQESFDEIAIRKKILLQNIYGVDLDERAVEIARLNLLLKAMDNLPDEALEGRKILPNLSLNIRCGNSLISGNYDEEIALTLFDDKSQYDADFQKLIELKEKFFNAIEDDEKQRIINELMIYEEKINSYCNQDIAREFKNLDKLKPFNYKVVMCEVFRKKGGFDCVIGNPPYISAVTHTKTKSSIKIRNYYRHHYPLVKGAFDIYTLFLIRGVELTNASGRYGWIIPNKFLVSEYATNVLSYLKENGLNKSVDVSTFNVFKRTCKGTGIYPIIIVGNKNSKYFTRFKVDNIEELKTRKLSKIKELKQYRTFRDVGIKIASGTTGFQANQVAEMLTEEKHKNSIPFIVSGSIEKYRITFANVRYINKTYRQAFIRKSTAIAESKWNFWLKEKIIIAGMTKQIESVYMKKPLALGVGVYAIYDYAKFHPKFLLGLLNSKFLSYYLYHKFHDKHLAGGYLAINKTTIEKLPIVDISKEQQKKLINLVNQMLVLQKNPEKNKIKIHAKNLEIDDLVYEIYSVSPEEKEIINKWAG